MLVPNITLEGFCVEKLRVRIEPAFGGSARIVAIMQVPDVQTGQTVMVETSQIVHEDLITQFGPKDWGHFARETLLRALEHELDERLRVEGELINPPHNPPVVFEKEAIVEENS